MSSLPSFLLLSLMIDILRCWNKLNYKIQSNKFVKNKIDKCFLALKKLNLISMYKELKVILCQKCMDYNFNIRAMFTKVTLLQHYILFSSPLLRIMQIKLILKFCWQKLANFHSQICCQSLSIISRCQW